MSYMTEVFMSRQLAEAARSLELVQAAQNHKLPADSKKHALLATVLKEHAARVQSLAANQSILSPDEFFKRAFDRVREMRAEAAVLAQLRREKRERDEAERAHVLNQMGMTAAA